MRRLSLALFSLLLLSLVTFLPGCSKHGSPPNRGNANDSTAGTSGPSDSLAALFYFFGQNNNGSGTSAILLNPDFSQRWRIDNLIGPSLTTPAYGDDMIFVSGNASVGTINPQDGDSSFMTSVQAIDVVTGKQLWVYQNIYLNAYPPFYFQHGVYAPDVGRITALNDSTGQGGIVDAQAFLGNSQFCWQDSSTLYILNAGYDVYAEY